jgi:uncharacterized protein (TIGR03435 family)
MTREKYIGSLRAALVLVFWAGASWGQSAAPLEFEVVSIKPSAPVGPGDGPRFFGCRGGPGSSDPGLITCSHEAAVNLVRLAYGMGSVRVSAAKVSSGTNWPLFEIAAKVSPGATKEQVNQMWQNLLEDRFRLAVHRETKEMPVYELVIGKGGFKAKEWMDRQGDAEPAPWEPGSQSLPKRDGEGFPVLAPGQTSSFFTGDKAYFTAPAGTVNVLAKMLERRLAIGERVPRPVIDETGLEGKYDIKFWWSSDSAEEPSMLSALESQLGLKLRPKKLAPVEMLVIDHLERTPTEN